MEGESRKRPEKNYVEQTSHKILGANPAKTDAFCYENVPGGLARKQRLHEPLRFA